MRPASYSDAIPDETFAWACLRALAGRAARANPICQPVGLALDANAQLKLTNPAHGQGLITLRPDLRTGWSSARALAPEAAQLLDLFIPLCTGPNSGQLVVAHLGQSADGHVATFSGTDKFITGSEDLRHTHRMRALFDAVLVGASTVAVDDPLLTTRLVEGPMPVRVVLDPTGRLRRQHQVFINRQSRTLVISACPRSSQLPEHVEHLQLPCRADSPGGFDVHELLARLQRRGLRRIFIEGGEITINHFLSARALDRLQIAVAPVTLGQGPRAVPENLQPSALAKLGRMRRFNLGADTLFEVELRAERLGAYAQGQL